MKTLASSLVSSVCVLAALAWPQASSAQIIFQTTFPTATCPDWVSGPGNLGDADVCVAGDQISGGGGSSSQNGSFDQITAAANNPAGDPTSKGFRHWVGDGLNNGGGGIRVGWTPTSEFWFRYYIRFPAGFTWGPNGINMKTIYCNQFQDGTFYFGVFFGLIGGHVEVGGFGGANSNQLSNVTWAQWQGGAVGDGTFHVLEVHAKMNTTGVSSDGVFEFWLDDVHLYRRTKDVHFSNATGTQFNNCLVGSNHNQPQNGGDVPVDFDDLAVSNVGYIGPIGNIRPPAPGTLTVQ